MTSQARSDVAAFLAQINALPPVDYGTVTAAMMRVMNIALISMAEVERGSIAIVRDIAIPGPAGNIPARIYDARSSREPTPVMPFYHGGGFVIGDLNTYDAYCAEAARQLDIPVISIDYRLAPEHRWPAAPDDCEAATRWIAQSPAELGYSVTGLVPSGDSAGGNLAIVTTMALRDNPAAVPIIAQFPIYPLVSGHGNWPSVADHGEGKLLTTDAMQYFGRTYGADPSSVRTSPLEFDQHGMPLSVVLIAELDPLRDQGEAYAKALEAAGVKTVLIEAKGNIHACVQLRKAIPSTADDVQKSLTALKGLIAQGVTSPAPSTATVL
jgi:acetyl esterase